ncbi:hypothetical protein AB0M29_43655 [Streptomyces sp. NPDC051976]|uniref:hypothetical protein n=1 Tax=Streptomyces sp. NPDC051976 TaxID=3154947 RepID=UPI0034362CD9
MTLGEGRRDRRLWRLVGGACAAAVAVSVVYAVWQAWQGRLGPADLVTVLGFPLAVAGTVGMLLGFRKSQEGTEAELALGQAATLARLVAEGEGRVLTQLLGKDTVRINLEYGLVPGPIRAASAPTAGLGFADPEAGLPDIAAYYRGTRPARLVITGAAGAGKTVLALQLLLGLIATRGGADPVPVRVPLAQWNTDIPLRRVLVRRLVDTFHLREAVAANLVAHGLVLPVLDGLDEMDPALPNCDPDPAAPRARAALDQLSAYQEAGIAAPLVLVCRTAHYDALATTDLLVDAARIAIAPVGSSPAVTYLTARARGLPRWQPLLDSLAAHPASVHARLLSTPWRLCLTATVYHRTGDPAELLSHPTADDLDEHLPALYITETLASDANPHRYSARQIHRWLHHLATHLAPTPWAPARTDIGLDRLWPMAGQARVRITDGLLAILSFLPLLPLAWATPAPTYVALCIGAAGLVIGLSCGIAGETAAGRFDFHQLATPAGRRGLVSGLVSGLAFGLLLGLLLGLASGLASGLVGGLASGLAFGLLLGLLLGLTGLAADQSSAARPGAIIVEDAQSGLVVGLVGGLASGLVGGLVGGLESGLALGLASGLASGLLLGRTAWRYMVFLLCARGRLPFRLARFLDWGCDVGLMRYSGPAYQFRHRELQLWLAAHPDPVA